MARHYFATGNVNELVRTKNLDNAIWFVIKGDKDFEPVVIDDRQWAKSAFTAYSDAFMMDGRYMDMEVSSPGVHVFASAKLQSSTGQRVGVVHQDIGEDELFPKPALEDCFQGWSNVELLNNVYITELPVDERTWKERNGRRPRPDTRKSMARKHSYIDAMLRNEPVYIWMAHMRPYVRKIMDTWAIEDPDERWATRNTNIRGKIHRKRHFEDAAIEDWQYRQGNHTVVDNDTGEIMDTSREVPQMMIAVMNTGRKRCVNKLPMGAYPVYTKSGAPLGWTLDWNPDDPEDNLGQWQIAVTNQYRISVPE
jgi:hypothetical protein